MSWSVLKGRADQGKPLIHACCFNFCGVLGGFLFHERQQLFFLHDLSFFLFADAEYQLLQIAFWQRWTLRANVFLVLRFPVFGQRINLWEQQVFCCRKMGLKMLRQALWITGGGRR